MKKNRTMNLTQGPVLSGILRFTLPIMLTYILQNLYNLVDTAIVGRFLGLQSLAAVGATSSVSFLIIGFVSGTCAGMAIPIAQQFGAGDHSKMRCYIFNTVLLSLMLSLLLTPLTVIYTRRILELMLTPADIIEEASLYIVIILAGIPVTFLYNVSSCILRAVGNSKMPLYFLIFSSVINIFLDILSVTVLNMDVRGPALATVISQLMSGILCVIYLCRKYPEFSFRKGEAKFDASLFRDLIFVGTPMGLQYSLTAFGAVILQASVNTMGSDIVAAVTIAGRISVLMGNSEMDSLGTAMATYVGQNYGAGRYNRIMEGMRKALLAGFIYSLIAVVIMYLSGNFLAGLFVTDDSNREIVIQYASQMAMSLSCTYFLLCILSVLRFSIQGLGYSYIALLSGISEMVARIFIGLVLIPAFGFPIVCFSNSLSWLLADITLSFCWIPIHRTVRKRLCSPVQETSGADSSKIKQ